MVLKNVVNMASNVRNEILGKQLIYLVWGGGVCKYWCLVWWGVSSSNLGAPTIVSLMLLTGKG